MDLDVLSNDFELRHDLFDDILSNINRQSWTCTSQYCWTGK
jgi:hypothetical protein